MLNFSPPTAYSRPTTATRRLTFVNGQRLQAGECWAGGWKLQLKLEQAYGKIRLQLIQKRLDHGRGVFKLFSHPAPHDLIHDWLGRAVLIGYPRPRKVPVFQGQYVCATLAGPEQAEPCFVISSESRGGQRSRTLDRIH